jgi:hypothetical protein
MEARVPFQIIVQVDEFTEEDLFEEEARVRSSISEAMEMSSDETGLIEFQDRDAIKVGGKWL